MRKIRLRGYLVEAQMNNTGMYINSAKNKYCFFRTLYFKNNLVKSKYALQTLNVFNEP